MCERGRHARTLPMSLAGALRSAATLEDLTRLVAELGHEPLWEELAPWPGVRRAATIGRHGRFFWVGAESTRPPAEVCREFARGVISGGTVSGLLVVYPEGRELGIAAGLERRATLTVSLESPSAVALAALARLRGLPARSAAAFALRAEEALAGRGVGAAFFNQFRGTLECAAAALTGRELRDRAHRRALALLQLTRVLFLYFVQSRGWLDGRPDFLRHALDHGLSRGRSLQRHLFDPLFFGTLNRPVSGRTHGVREFGALPFLNGGLFEPHPLERRYRPALPDETWREAFDQLFERYHFTVSEAEGGTAIAPDMLGRVFEGVMDSGRRKASGTFYTPAALVSAMIDAALGSLGSVRLSLAAPAAAELLEECDPAMLTLLRSITLLDPACGSGAFLLGALERLSRIHVASGAPESAARRRVLRRQIFGVDLDGMAIRLAELRLWLAVVAAEDTVVPSEVRPLPNLDSLIRQGDTLHGPDGSRVILPGAFAARAGTLRGRLVTATGSRKRELAAALRRLEREAAIEWAVAVERAAEGTLTAHLDALRAPDLFGGRTRPSSADRRTLRVLRLRLRRARAARRALEGGGEVPWFQYESHFADVMARGGFDIVIGNPPWVRAEELAPDARERLAERYRWWRTGAGRGYAHRPDLSVAFLQRAHELAAPGGVVAMLVPAKVATAGYGAVVRAALARTTTIEMAADLAGDPRAAFGATVYPMALITTRRVPPDDHVVRSTLDPGAARVAQRSLGAGPWYLARPDAAELAARIRAEHPPFGDVLRPRLGVKTGANAAFLDPPPIEATLTRRALRGRDISAFAARPHHRILWPCDARGNPLGTLPPLAAMHLSAHERALRARSDYLGGAWWTLFRTTGALDPHRVVWADLARELTAVVPADDTIALNSCYLTSTSSRTRADAVAAWMNSTWIGALSRIGAPPATGGFFRFPASVIAALPAPPTDDAELARLGAAGARGEEVQESIDERVAVLLGLGRAERAQLADVARAGSDHRR